MLKREQLENGLLKVTGEAEDIAQPQAWVDGDEIPESLNKEFLRELDKEVIKMIVARWNVRAGISLEEMQSYKSIDIDAGGYEMGALSGLATSTCAAYLLRLIERTIFDGWTGKLRSKFRTKASLGEIVIMEAEDTGARCMDGMPVVQPVRIVERIPASNFINWKYLRDENLSPVGPMYKKVRDILDAEHHQEAAYNERLKKLGYEPYE